MRDPAPPALDKAHFRRTANSTKAVNLSRVVYRGGIRF